MGIKFLIFLALLIGVFYCLHLLVKDYQAVTAPRLLRLLFKRDITADDNNKPNVRWRKILQYDQVQCVRYLFCELGTEEPATEIRRGFIFMLTINPRQEDSGSHEVFKKAYESGRKSGMKENCGRIYPSCPFKISMLLDIVQYLLQRNTSESKTDSLKA